MIKSASAPWPNDPIASELGRRLRLVARRMNHVILRQEYPPSYLQILRVALRQKGRLLSSSTATGHPVCSDDSRLHALPVLLAHAITSETATVGSPMAQWRAIAPIAAAAEFLALAMDLSQCAQTGIGEIIDQIGLPATVNIAVTFCSLTHAALADEQTPQMLCGPLHAMFAAAMAHVSGMRVAPGNFLVSAGFLPLWLGAGALVGAYPLIKATPGDMTRALSVSASFRDFGQVWQTDGSRLTQHLKKLNTPLNLKIEWLRHYCTRYAND